MGSASPTGEGRSATRSVRQFEPVALGALLAARRLGRLLLALAAHAGKDDDLRTRCFSALARLCARVPRTEVEYHGHCVPLAAANVPRPPPSHDAHASRVSNHPI